MDSGDAKKKALALKEDFRGAELSPGDRAMLEYAEKITLVPWTVGGADIEKLREAGFSDVQILEIATVSSYRNYIARVASGLGVELDDGIFADDAQLRSRMEEGLT
ncbi:MAG: peroxidase [bacterium]|nr:peroxidase [bacterium]